jgi:hypothetical protein
MLRLYCRKRTVESANGEIESLCGEGYVAKDVCLQNVAQYLKEEQ